MVEFRAIEQVKADLVRHNPSFDRIPDAAYLIDFLTDDDAGDAVAYVAGGGPILYDLGVLNGPEWEGVNRFLNSELVSQEARKEFSDLRQDLLDADRKDLGGDGDGVVSYREMVRVVRNNPTRWANVAQFQNASDVLLNRLPAYLSQPELDDKQISRLWGVLNHVARELDKRNVPADERGTIYGLSLVGFPSEQEKSPPDPVPDLVLRAMNGELSPQELAAVHHVLKTRMGDDGQYVFEETAPLSPNEIDQLNGALAVAAEKRIPFHGMTVLAGNKEIQAFQARNDAVEKCASDILAASESTDPDALPQAFQNCVTEMAKTDGDQADSLGATALLTRAITGDLSPGEAQALRAWMKDNAEGLGLIPCDGAVDCLAYGARQMVNGILEDPWHFVARNAAFLGGSYLYRRLLLRNAFENRLSEACGMTIANPKKAYQDYEKYLSDQMKGSAAWKRFANQVVKNPRKAGWLGKIFVNFPVTFGHLAAFNAIASQKDTGNLAVDILTDLPLIALFGGWDTYDAFNKAAITRFAAQNPGACPPVPEPVRAVQPETAPEPLASDPACYAHDVETVEDWGYSESPVFAYETEMVSYPVPEAVPFAFDEFECNGIDDDCDAEVDEGPCPPGRTCTSGLEIAGEWVAEKAEGIGWAGLGIAAGVATIVLIADDVTGVGVADDPALAATAPTAAYSFSRAAQAFGF